MTAAQDAAAEEFVRFYGREAWTDWLRLLAHFDWGEGFAFLVLLLPGAVGAELCRRQLTQHLWGKGKRLVELPCQQHEDARRLAEWVLAVPAAGDLGGVWLGAVIPESDPGIQQWRQAWREGLAALNQRRNLLRGRLACPLVLVGAPWLHTLLREAAPDLWSVRTGVVSVTPSPEPEDALARGVSRIGPEPARALAGEASSDPDYVLEHAERLRDKPGRETVRAHLLLRAGNGFYANARIEAAEKCFREAAALFAGLSPSALEVRRDWAATLNNSAISLRVLGRREEALEQAQEAARICAQLASARPDSFLPDWAMSLDTLANSLSASGRREEAFEKAQEAARVYARLAETEPGVFLPRLAMSLDNLAASLGALGRQEEALDKAQEAVRILAQLAGARPGSILPQFVMSLSTQISALGASGRWEEALAKAQEAVRVLAQPAREQPDALIPLLASLYWRQGTIFGRLARHAEAARSFAEAIRALGPLFQRNPSALARVMENLAGEYQRSAAQAGQEPDASLLAPLHERLEELKATTPKA